MIQARVARGLSALLLIVVAGGAARSDAATLSVPEYLAELDALTASIASGERAANSLPLTWRVDGGPRTFDISTEWLTSDLRAWNATRDAGARRRLLARLRTLRTEAAGFQEPSADAPQARRLLSDILDDREFRNVHGPTWMDRLRQRALELFYTWFRRLFESSTFPAASAALVYILIALAVGVVALWTYRVIRRDAAVEAAVADSPIPPGQEWPEWLARAQSAAERGHWRDAVHFAYWCAVSFLEVSGAWHADRARTPREYLRLLPSGSHELNALTALTRRFELAWYGAQDADAQTYAEAIATLKELGCPSA